MVHFSKIIIIMSMIKRYNSEEDRFVNQRSALPGPASPCGAVTRPRLGWMAEDLQSALGNVTPTFGPLLSGSAPQPALLFFPNNLTSLCV